MSLVVEEILISGLQEFKQYRKLNPIDIKIDDNQILSPLSNYGKYRLNVTSLLISVSFSQTNNLIFITCNGLNDAKKALKNGKIHNILGAINLTEETNFDLIKKSSTWLNIIFRESNREAKHFSFKIIWNSLQDILSFSYSMLDGKGNLLTFLAEW